MTNLDTLVTGSTETLNMELFKTTDGGTPATYADGLAVSFADQAGVATSAVQLLSLIHISFR